MIPLHIVYDPATQSGTFFIDNSSTEKMDVCNRSAQYYLSNRRETSKEKPALQFGKIIHKVLEHRYRNMGASVLDQRHDLIALAQAEFAKWTPPDGDYRNFATAVDVIDEYANKYNYESFDILDHTGIPGVEIPFACPLVVLDFNSDMAIWDGPNIIVVHIRKLHIVWKGKIDMLTTREGRLYIYDHKTTSMMGPSFFADFAISGQVYGYVWSVKELTGLLASGFTINALGIRPPTKTGKKLEFARHTVPIYPELVDEWWQDTINKLSDLFEMARRGYMPKQTKWCAGKYGLCEYHGVCTLPPASRAIALSTNEFKDVTWDPLKNED